MMSTGWAQYTLMTKSTVAKTGDIVDSGLCHCYLKVDCRRLIWLCRPCHGQHCRQSWTCSTRLTSSKWVIFVARMSNVVSTLSPVCTGSKKHVDHVEFDFVSSVYRVKETRRPCRIRLCLQCVQGQRNTSTMSNSTVASVYRALRCLLCCRVPCSVYYSWWNLRMSVMRKKDGMFYYPWCGSKVVLFSVEYVCLKCLLFFRYD